MGIDLGAALVDLAKQRLVPHSDNVQVADAWTWEPGRQWMYVYSTLDLAPDGSRCEWLRRLFSWVEPEGTLIIGTYGSRSKQFEPVAVGTALEQCGFPVDRELAARNPEAARFAWTLK